MKAGSTKRRWWQRGHEDRALGVENVPALMLQHTQAGVPVSPRGAMSVADCYAAIRVLSDAAATLPLHVYRRASGGRERVEGGVAELLQRPAPAVTQASLVASMLAHLNLWGECFLGLYRDETGAVFQIGLLAPDRITVEQRGGLPTYGYADEDGRYGIYSMRDILHVKAMSVDQLRGVSPVRQAREALGYASALAEHGAKFMRNGARPSGVLHVESGVHADEQIENLREAWAERHEGATNAGKVALLTGEVKFEPVSMPLQDAEYVAQRELSTQEVARIFRVPPFMLGAKTGDSLTYSTVAEQARAFVLFSLKPWLVAIEQALSGCVELFAPESRTYCQFELDGLLRGDPAARAAVYTQALNPQTGWMNRPEVREMEDLPREAEQPTEPELPEAEQAPAQDDREEVTADA